MRESVKVEINGAQNLPEDVAAIKAALPDYDVYAHGGNVVVDVDDSNDAVDEVTAKLDEAGVRCYVSDYPADERAAGNLSAAELAKAANNSDAGYID